MGGSHSTTTLPETGGDRSEVVMSKNNIEDNRVEQIVETVKSTMRRDVEPEVESVLKVGEVTKEVAEKHVAEVAFQNNVEKTNPQMCATNGQRVVTTNNNENKDTTRQE